MYISFNFKLESTILNRDVFIQFIDDVEFWFPPGNRSLVEYRSASRIGKTDFDINRKRIRVFIYLSLTESIPIVLLTAFGVTDIKTPHSLQALRLALEKKGWQSVGF